MDERYNISHNQLGTVPNVQLASDMGKELQPLILSMIVMHGGQVKREREMYKPKYMMMSMYKFL